MSILALLFSWNIILGGSVNEDTGVIYFQLTETTNPVNIEIYTDNQWHSAYTWEVEGNILIGGYGYHARNKGTNIPWRYRFDKNSNLKPGQRGVTE